MSRILHYTNIHWNIDAEYTCSICGKKITINKNDIYHTITDKLCRYNKHKVREYNIILCCEKPGVVND